MSLALAATLSLLTAAPPAFADLGEPAVLIREASVLLDAEGPSDVLVTLPAGTDVHAMPTDQLVAQVSVVLEDGSYVEGFISTLALSAPAVTAAPATARSEDPHDLAALVALITARERPAPVRAPH